MDFAGIHKHAQFLELPMSSTLSYPSPLKKNLAEAVKKEVEPSFHTTVSQLPLEPGALCPVATKHQRGVFEKMSHSERECSLGKAGTVESGQYEA